MPLCRDTYSPAIVHVQKAVDSRRLTRHATIPIDGIGIHSTLISNMLTRISPSNFYGLPKLVSKTFSNLSSGWKAFMILIPAILARLQFKIKKEIDKASNSMEKGWFKRGYGNSFSRTIEVWSFVIFFALSWVSTA